MKIRNTKVNAFPSQYRWLIEEAELNGTLDIPCPPELRLSLRTSIAKYLKAIRIESEAWDAEQADRVIRPKAPWFHAFAQFARQVSISTTPNGLLLHPKEKGKLAQVIENVRKERTGLSSDDVLEAKIQESLAEFAKLQEAKTPEKGLTPEKREAQVQKELEGPLFKLPIFDKPKAEENPSPQNTEAEGRELTPEEVKRFLDEQRKGPRFR
jgi:hypothetical protein